MSIVYDKENQVFHLQAGDTSYVMGVVRGYLTHLYWGKRLNRYGASRRIIWKDRGFAPNPDDLDRAFSLDTLPQEYPQTGNGDYRNCAYGMLDEQGGRISNLIYQGYEILHGKEPLSGLPASFGNDDEVDTLKIHMLDELSGLKVELWYHAFHNQSVIARSVRFVNTGEENLTLTKMLSMSVDIREAGFDVLTLYGAHNNERNMDRRRITSGTVQIESLRGTSSPQQAPFMALLRPETTEDFGEVYAANFVYSGNFIAAAQTDAFENTRFQMGMNPWNGQWLLEPGQEFHTPEVVMVYTSEGLNEMSKIFHNFYQDHLIRSQYTKKIRPILINNWEATYFDFTEEKILEIADKAAQVGIELFVLDDGWFGKRDDTTSSLGDWIEDRRKLPDGLKGLEEKIHEKGLQFGLWLEPEMISENSDLYRRHPDYVLHTPGRPYTYGRGQLVLDLSREDVCDYVIESISKVLESAQIDYVKWDMNRHLTDVGSGFYPAARQGEITHRYVLGLYRILETLTNKYPDILFESCSSGGGRFDPGMLYYMPQTWCSDNTDAVCRLKIQYATSLTYPPITIGAHVSGCPNQQTGRETSLSTRGFAAMSANMGYELDLTKCSEEELEQIKQQVDFYKEIRETIQFGTFYRTKNPFEGNLAQWNFVSKDGKDVVGFYFEILSRPAAPIQLMKFKGLERDGYYKDLNTGKIYGGDELMYSGISIPIHKQDFRSECYHFRKVNENSF
ncbi:MAG TPA: alpha-galactosidase [Candidatus Anaerostipes excrementavium]|uniref:Alpha-galactosidase n=1 Tax=Candidatus Anaerostipes excrementavium TaxID=2838463 RepID=A0A9D1WWE5_9FIRM|nr:alpha-galactosidase [uncultured Anaerostipes sp.]HIX68483.1 alpha-galactosidase [Candidatus Anaerostipes excrementavium]